MLAFQVTLMWHPSLTMLSVLQQQQQQQANEPHEHRRYPPAEASRMHRIHQEQQQALYLEYSRINPLSVPQGYVPNLPSVRHSEEKLDEIRDIYGGAGDGQHLGGFTQIDLDGISPYTWTQMLQVFGVRSILDVGCGRGISTRWFYEHEADVLCVEGSHDAVTKSFLPSSAVVEHDFSRGPWWPNENNGAVPQTAPSAVRTKTFDALWCVEFLEHVSRQYHYNFIQTFRTAALIFVTSSKWGGWHHVEVHPDTWWVQKFESYGLRYSQQLTDQVRQWALLERNNKTGSPFFEQLVSPTGEPFKAQHVFSSMKVFVNPVVASLPEHAHLFPRDGCFKEYCKPNERRPEDGFFPSLTRPCGSSNGTSNSSPETPLPPHFLPLNVEPEMHRRWDAVIRKGISFAPDGDTGEHKAANV